jgi:DNA/RNA-binding domain of Phe-tRNA-synthetase-like protein
VESYNLIADPAFAAGLVWAEGVRTEPSAPALQKLIAELVQLRSAEEFPPLPIKDAVRKLLKRGGFKPSGRNKPASEYLAQAAREGRFPLINNLVDINNLLSLETGLPISLLDARAFGGQVRLRCGRAGESYVFNSAGQEIDLEGLICACGGDGPEGVPLGNPVKDSMAGKLQADTSSVIGVIYASLECDPGRCVGAQAERFGQLLREFGGAQDIRTAVVGGR